MEFFGTKINEIRLRSGTVVPFYESVPTRCNRLANGMANNRDNPNVGDVERDGDGRDEDVWFEAGQVDERPERGAPRRRYVRLRFRRCIRFALGALVAIIFGWLIGHFLTRGEFLFFSSSGALLT